MIRRVLLLLLRIAGLARETPATHHESESLLQRAENQSESSTAASPLTQMVSPEQELIQQALPPTAIIETLSIVRMGPGGEVQKRTEVTQMTPNGAALVRTDVLFVDDFGVAGRVENLKGVCASCGRVSFAARPCAVCGLCVCPGCGGEFVEGKQAVFLCSRHLRSAKWNAAIWTDQSKSTGE